MSARDGRARSRWWGRGSGALLVALAVMVGLAGQAQAAGGYLDPGFGAKGTVVVRGASDLAVDAQGRITGIARVSGSFSAMYRTRLAANGQRDPSFTAGPVIDGWEGLGASETVLLPDGGSISSWWVCCNSTDPRDNAMFQSVKANGQVYPHGEFGPTFGIVTMPMPGPHPLGPGGGENWDSQAPGGLVRLPDGRLRACASLGQSTGVVRDAPSYPAVLWGFTADGRPDPAVGPDGLRIIPGLRGCGSAKRTTGSGVQESAHGLFVDGTGTHLYLIGPGETVNPSSVAVVRTDLNGVPDTSYGDGGTFELASASRSYLMMDAEVTRMGTVYLGLSGRDTAAGSRSNAMAAKVTSDGALDLAFGSAGVAPFAPAGGSSRLDTLGFLPGGRLVLGLTYATPGKRSGQLVAVSATSAQPDLAFGAGGTVVTNLLATDTVLQGSSGLVISAYAMPADPVAPLGIAVIQRRKV